MPRTLGRIWIASIALAMAVLVGTPALASSPTTTSVLAGTPIRSVYVREPLGGTQPGKPLQVLVALHGMGGNGEAFARDLTEQADKYGWLIVAPTIDYGDWTRPELVATEDPLLIRVLGDYLDQLPQVAGRPVRRTVLVLGHSRGAQLAHRFAEFRPDRVLAVAALAAGTYTLPLSTGPHGPLSFPFGIRDLAQYGGRPFDAVRFGAIQFWVGVGGQDNNPNDLPRQWDSVEGTTRLQRAEAFAAAMDQLGASTTLRVFKDTRHEVTPEMRLAACAFLGGAMHPRAPYGTPVTAAPIAY